MGYLVLFVAVILAGLVTIALIGPNRIVDAVEGVLSAISRSVKQSLSDYIDIENVDVGDPYTFVLRDGSLMTLLRHEGSLQLIGKEEFEEADAAVNGLLDGLMRNKGHAIQTVFTSDPDLAERLIREAQAPMRATAARLELDVEDIFEEEVGHLSKQCSSEVCLIALYTRPSALGSRERKDEARAVTELLKAHPLPTMDDAPLMFRAVRGLRSRHASFVESFLMTMKHQKMVCDRLEVHDASREIRRAIDPEWTDESWRPCLMGDPIPVRESRRNPDDVSGALWPPLGPQLAPRNAEELNLRHVKIGNRSYAPMYFHLAPQDVQNFQRLFVRMSSAGMPWRMSTLVESGQGGLWGFKSFWTMLFKWSSPSTNRAIQQSLEFVDQAEQEGRTRVRLRMDLATWAPAGETALLEQRASQVALMAQGWGTPEIQEVSGDPVQALIAGGPGASLKSVATPALAMLDDVTHFLPLYRPASAWRTGAMLFRTPDGKPWPYQPHSSVQSSWNSCIYAEPRSGKSVLCNGINWALCLSPGLTRLPLIAIVDVGRASAGLISLLQHGLPPSKRHQVLSIRMRNSASYAINPFDTQLGNRYPLAYENAFLLNLLLTLLTPHGKESADPDMSPLCSGAIKLAYDQCSEGGQPKRYSRNLVGAEEVDRAIDQYGMHVDMDTTWWEVVDQLFEHGAYHQAMLAQRFAVPLLQDVAAASQSPQFQDLYGEKKSHDGSEPLLKAFVRMLSEAVRAYPVLSQPTRFDLGEARVVSIDLDEVAKSGSAAADHQSAVFYMLARYAAARDFYLHEDYLINFNPGVRAYHAKRIEGIRQDKKHLLYDEFHRTKKIRAVREQVMADKREGGKAGVMVTLISQGIGDFDQDMLGFASCKIILSKANEHTVSEMKRTFGITPTLEYNVKHNIKPPGPKGATFVGMWEVKEGACAQLLNNTMGGIKLWAFSTSLEDTLVRDALYEKLGPKPARQLLAKLFPGGSVAAEIERRKAGMSATEAESAINQFVDELIDKYAPTLLSRAA